MKALLYSNDPDQNRIAAMYFRKLLAIGNYHYSYYDYFLFLFIYMFEKIQILQLKMFLHLN